ncbi:hypothetical protein ROJ8625_00917 [Roseivivax jejudonensis]|uniref:DUF6455 domain-containing protein n=1 Tax=Roseivivax jejudonensis TaxID=1529041 RepID=A0A1X6YKC5_9RHOB|nr:DUF6455 family protein [Roseivivax jejudonensis]SLN23108.1 hypothetical protein ROJ8625_00917 [Roseivivax jejudonensis]
MLSRDVLKRHAALVDRMSDTLGIDLEERALRGDVQIPEINDAVLACAGCSQPYACESWLAKMAAPQPAPPEYCRNADLFARLSPDD